MAGSTMARASSGSRSSISSIEPLMSANNAVTVLRSPSSASDASGWPLATRTDGDDLWIGDFEISAASCAPHSSQNLAPGLLIDPHFAHLADSGEAHSLQNLAPSRVSAPHFEHRIGLLKSEERARHAAPLPQLVMHRAAFVARAADEIAQPEDVLADSANVELARSIGSPLHPSPLDLAEQSRVEVGRRRDDNHLEVESRVAAGPSLDLIPIKDVLGGIGRVQQAERRMRPVRERAAEHRPNRRDRSRDRDENHLDRGRMLHRERPERAREAQHVADL